ncbi:MFS general substrate transporter [Calocera cornea HHB12733]|uniref:MFS general substrate transporter n=1 Tax=Calocera cornea HHB12733 TaxID=1353952 RepID=A0A165JGZ8_9BASI|nr:MFS general substrate transporter [Calocera cornea HHB12733]
MDEHEKERRAPLTREDRYAIGLLIILYLIQGIPIGLAFGSIPFLLKSRLSYSEIGVFTLCTYPYSLKLFWSPIVDSIFSPKLGRRKSWIVPIQTIMGCLMIWMGANAPALLDAPTPDVGKLTVIFTTLVFFAATQDIAVDGWALTLLSKDNLSYASTCQTIGLNSGYFLSFTVFLALNSVEFANKYWRKDPLEYPLLSLGAYLQFWGVICFCVTLGLLFLKKEEPVHEDSADLNLTKVYKIMWRICQLKHVQSLCLMHLVSKVGFQANDAVSSLKMVEKGLQKEDLAIAVLIDFPCQIIGGWLAARWSVGAHALRPWLYAYWVRLAFCLIFLGIVYWWPQPPLTMSFFAFLVLMSVLSSFAGTIQFVGVSAFHTQIADPVIGGTYMTVSVHIIANLGGTWPRYFVLKGVDLFSVATCSIPQGEGDEIVVQASECISEHGLAQCKDLGGTCVTEKDGFYTVSWICMTLGVIIFLAYIGPAARRLQAVPAQKWRVHTS